MYELIFEKRALNFLNKLEHNIKKRIWNKLQECKENPFRYLEHLTEIKGYKLRIGDYRLIIDLEQKIKILHILKIGHRKNIYER
jgi:mRNA interferase RelE/StbE